MPVTGEFLADFNNFVVGAKKADAELKRLEDSGVAVGTALDSAFQDFNIEQLFSNPVQAATGLAQDFAGKIGTVGTVAIGAVAAVGALATGAIALGNSFAETAAQLGDLREQTGLSLTELSKLTTAASLAGTTVDALAAASLTMQQRMANNPQEFIRGLEALNVNAKEFESLHVDQQFEVVATALADMTDPQTRVIAGQDLMGKQFKEMAPALMEIGGGLLEVADGLGHVFTDDDVDKAKAYNRQWAELKAGLGGIASDIGSVVVPALLGLGQMFEDLVAAPVRKGWEDTKNDFRKIGDAIDWVGGNARQAAPPMDELAAATARYGNAAADAEKRAKALADQTTKDIARQNKEYADWLAQQAQYRKEEKDAAQKAADDRAAEEKKRAADALAEEKRRAAERMALERETALTLQDLYGDYYDAVAVESKDATQKQIDDVWRQMNEKETALALDGKLTTEMSNVLVATATAKAQKIAAAAAAEQAATNAVTDATEDAWAATVKIAAAQDELDDKWVRASATARGYSKDLVDVALATEELGRSSLDTSGKLSKMAAVLDAYHDQWNAMERQSPSSGLHQETRFGQQYLVDAEGNVASGALQAQYGAGGFLGYGLPQGQTMQNVINISGILMGNDPSARQQLADVVGRSLSDSLKSQGVRLGSGV